MVTRIEVETSVLRWARETARIDLAEAARRIGVQESILMQWESGERTPTIKQLRKAAQVYNRPLGALFLPEPPTEDEPFTLPDFRRDEMQGEESAALRNAILAAKERLQAIETLAEEGVELPFELSDFTLSVNDDPEAAGERLREELDLASIARRSSGSSEMLRALIESALNMGYLTMQVQRIDYAEMRGFSLKGDIAAIIVLNSAGYPRGKVFTLLHEIVHIALRGNSLCDLSREYSSDEERFCDEVAAAALMPAKDFLRIARDFEPFDYGDFRLVADNFGHGVSAESALLRAVELGVSDWTTYWELRPEFQKAYRDFRDSMRPAAGQPGPPLYYQLKRRDLGRQFISVISRGHEDGFISARDTAGLLDISYHNLPKLRGRSEQSVV